MKNLWEQMMVRLWAIKHEVAYRHKAVKNFAIFLAALVIICEIFCVYFYGGLSVFGILAIIIVVTLLAYCVLTKGGKDNASND